MKKWTAILFVFLFAAIALAQQGQEDEMMRKMLLERIKMVEIELARMKEMYAQRFGKLDEKPKPPASIPVDLKPGELLFILNDGSKLKGTVAISDFKLKTTYGTLTIPLKDTQRITFAQISKSGGGEKRLEKQQVVTAEFTAKGIVEVDKFKIRTGRGELTVPKSDIRQILFAPQAGREKKFELKPTGQWLDTGIKLAKGDKLTISAEGTLELKDDVQFKPDGSQADPPGKPATDLGVRIAGVSYPLMARIGEKGKEFKAGSSCDKQADEEGTLYLKIQISEAAKKFVDSLKGSYKVKVRKGSTVAKPTEAQEMAASQALGRARYFDQANPYEDKEIVAAKYKEVVDKYPGTAAAKEAAEILKKVMKRKR